MKFLAVSLLILSFSASAQRVKENIKQQQISGDVEEVAKVVKPALEAVAPKIQGPKKPIDGVRKQ
jgi:hypothetical protein